MTEEERKEAIEHRDVLLALRQVLTTAAGQQLFKYFFKYFEVGKLPAVGLEGNLLFENLGLMRAGRSIFELACEANSTLAAQILAELEKERYAELYADAQIGHTQER